MKKLVLSLAFMFSLHAVSFAASTPTITLVGPSTDPLTSFLITDNYSHVVSTANMYWFKLNYNGTGTAYIRIMDSTDKTGHPLIPIRSQTSYSTLIHKNAKYFNYSSAAGTTNTGNSVVEVLGK